MTPPVTPVTRPTVAPGPGWVVDLPDGWLPTAEPGAPSWTDDVPVPGAAAPLEALLAHDRAAGAATTAWSPAAVAGRGVLATHSILPTAPEPIPGSEALSPDLDVVLPHCRGTMSVVVAVVEDHPVLVVTHDLEVAAGLRLVLVGRTTNVPLADELVRLFHLVAASTELVPPSTPPAADQPAVVRT